jgi:hypothetical protein
MTQFIAHRGNLNGPEPTFENRIEYLLHAYDVCGAVEVDIQTHNGQLYFGHDDPQQPVSLELIMQDNWFCHAKDLESLSKLLELGAHTFWHQQDTVTITSRGYIWCYPDVYLIDKRAIWLDFEDKFTDLEMIGGWGLCSDRYPMIRPVHSPRPPISPYTN